MQHLLKTTDVRNKTGFSLLKIRTLIEQGKLKAINTSTKDRPYYNVTAEALDAFLRGVDQSTEPVPNIVATVRNQRIDANVPKVFG